MNELEFGLAAVYRIIKKTGAERVGDDAAEELRTVLEEFGIKIAEQALVYAKHAGRKTVKSSDIRLAVNEIVFSTSIVLSVIVFSCNTKSGTSNSLFPSNSSFIVKPSASFSLPVNAVAL